MYGENNEQSQKVLYEFEEQPTVKAFFVVRIPLSFCATQKVGNRNEEPPCPQAALLLGGHGDEDLSSYVFKPIQRICKYPLLFRVRGLAIGCGARSKRGVSIHTGGRVVWNLERSTLFRLLEG